MSRSGRGGYTLVAVHDYGAEHRLLRYRKGNITAIERETRGTECWVPGLLGAPTSALPLYREREVRMTVAGGKLVLLVESESSAVPSQATAEPLAPVARPAPRSAGSPTSWAATRT